MAGNQSSEDGLRYLNDEEATKRIPVMIYLGLVSLVGLAGNVHVLVVFGVCYKTSNFRCFVLCLAALDTMSCVVAMPFEIFDMRYPYMFSASDVCSAFRYTNTVLAVSSAMILVAIAAERFRKICQPFKKQLTVNRAKAMCVITLLASALFCIPAALSQGLSTVDLGKNITGHDCSVKDSVRATSLPIVEAIMGLFGAVAIIISLIVMYSCIATHLIRHKNRLSRHINGHVPTSGNNRCNINSASPTNTNEETNSNEVMEDDSNMSESSGPSEDVKIENSSLKFKGDEKTSRISSQEFSNTKNCMESGKKTFKFATEYTSKTTPTWKHFFSRFLERELRITMPPKKKGDAAANAPPPLIGRVGTNLKIGIVGLPNVGKSTFFNVLTKSQATAENFPFCTIDPNESRVPVPDARYDYLVDQYKPYSKVPAFLNVVDIAGLVKGAHEGKGLGNAFLSNINACDAIFHVMRSFDDDEIVHVEGDVDPCRDLEIIHDELRLKDLEYLAKHLEPMERNVARGGDKKLKPEFDCLVKVRDLLLEKKLVRQSHWDAKEIDILNHHLFLTSKPVIYLVNLSIKDYNRKKNKWQIKEWIDKYDSGATIIPFSGALELDLMDMSEEEKKAYLTENKTQSSLEKIIVTGYKALGLMYFFTTGKDEVRAWTIQTGTKAPQAAGRIHTDFERGFIMAEVMAYQDFKEHESEANCKAAGKYKQKGRDYVVEDGDIILFKFNAGAGLKDKKK
ncbi:hypothetical protein ScPMuIL_017251 [Solemya velum]